MSIKRNNSPGYFFFLSGENPELAFFELESIVLTLDSKLSLNHTSDPRIITLTIKEALARKKETFIVHRIMAQVTMIHSCCSMIFQKEFLKSTPDHFEDLVSGFQAGRKDDGLNRNTSFCVRTKRINDPSGILTESQITQELSRFFGKTILEKYPTKNVSLEQPEEIYQVIVSKNGLWYGLQLSISQREIVRKRSARDRPFFHPSSMNPILQRTLLNLASIKAGEWLLDPFCGTGGGLIEAGHLGYKSVGVELDRRIIWGARKNLKSDSIASVSAHLIRGDAKHLGFKKGVISAIVTDPPYGTAASTKGYNLADLLLEFFRQVRIILDSGSRIVIAVPSTLIIEEDASKILNASFVKFMQYVHRSLTRKILVFTLK
ncbi:MAG: DNA methyltransferase [Candidatus Hodarchaeales archaeon]|jgi:tRNA (guanine10-N2)-dimethyltransferase